MDRMTDTNIPAARRDSDEDGYFAPLMEPACCEHCGHGLTMGDSITRDAMGSWHTRCLNLSLEEAANAREEAEEVDYRALALAAIRKQAARVMLADAGCTAAEITAYESKFGEVA